MHVNARFAQDYAVAEKLLKSLIFIVVLSITTTAWSQNYQSNINAASSWLASTSNPQVTLADGAVVDGANSTRINPYFANLGIIGFTRNSTYYGNVKNWMEWYWNHVSWPRNFNVNGSTVSVYGAINDFDVGSGGAETATPDPDLQGNHHPDSTDAYAGTFLSLAYAYYQTGDATAQAYINSIVNPAPPNSDRLDYVGEVIIATKQDASGQNHLTWARPDYNIEYLMDACEAYRGLRDLANLYTVLGLSTKASFYNSHADQMLSGIQTALWNSANSDYDWYTTNTGPGTDAVIDWTIWYPRSVSQVFPIAFGIIQPTDQQAINLWNTFQSHWQSKWTTLTTGDAYPWVIVGYVAALMGDTTDANTFINNLQSTYVNNNFAGNSSHLWSTNEAGWFIRLNALLLNGGGGGSGVTVTVTTPANNASLTSPVNVQASASSSHTITGWHIYDNNTDVFSAGQVNSINASLNLAVGSHTLITRAWDSTGAFGDQTRTITVNPGCSSISVTVTAPQNGATVTSPVNVEASACAPNAITGWHIYDNGNDVFSAGQVNSINASLNLAVGSHTLVVRAWDGTPFADQTVNITVSSGSAGVPASNHVYVVVLENHSYSSVIGSSSMPNFNNMANSYGLATNYFANTHPSIGNYFEMTTGQIITNDDTFSSTVTADNIVRHMISAGKTWKEYSENLPSTGYTGSDCCSGYIQHHNPLAYFSDVRGTSQANNLVNFSQLQADISAGTLPNFGFIVPNNCDNAHDCSLTTADNWLQSNIFQTLVQSAPFQAGGDGLLFIVFDESDTSDTTHGGGQVAAILIGPKVKNGFRSTTFYQHQSLLRTVEESLGLSLFGDAASAPDMAEFFK